jgi:heme oxygenase (biliverdin-producing, ferredoxin)
LLARSPSLEADIAYLLKVPESSWKSHPLHHSLVISPPPALTAYVARLRELADSEDPSPLLAHAYVRYLGDLSGGQTIKHTLARAYDLDSPGLGLSFYEFKELTTSKTASLGELRRIKDWYRDGMNKGVGDDVVKKGKSAI